MSHATVDASNSGNDKLVRTSFRYVIETRIKGLEEKKHLVRMVHTNKVDPAGKPIYEAEYQIDGWFVLFEDSSEWRFLDMEKPPFTKGQKMRIIIVGE